jgi:hypothetical protein
VIDGFVCPAIPLNNLDCAARIQVFSDAHFHQLQDTPKIQALRINRFTILAVERLDLRRGTSVQAKDRPLL